jgi:hypothetical protein
MKSLHGTRTLALMLALANWVIPIAQTSAAQPPGVNRTTPAQTSTLRARDVALDVGGQLRGRLVNRSAQPVPGVVVFAVQNGQQVAQSSTDRNGEFTLVGLRGGMVQIASQDAISICRAWAPGTAPPSATQNLLVIQQDVLQRGQIPLSEALFSDPIVLGLFVAAAIAVPIAISNSRNKKDVPAS